MQLPGNMIERLSPMFPGLDLYDVDVVVSEPARVVSMNCCPHAYARAGSSPRRGIIYINPRFWSPNSRETMRLVAHELYHQWQLENIPGFETQYSLLAAETEEKGLPPWEHPLEKPAYAIEGRV